MILISSDGLTSMISDEEVASILRAGGTLEEAADTLVRAANQSGGKDNITVMCSVSRRGAEPRPPTAATRPRSPARSAPLTCARRRTPRRLPTTARRTERAPVRRARRSRVRALVGGLVAIAVLAAALTRFYALSRQVYFVGTNDAGLVTLYRGVPYELPFGLDLYEEQYASGDARAGHSGRAARKGAGSRLAQPGGRGRPGADAGARRAGGWALGRTASRAT